MLGDLAADVPAVNITRTGPGSIDLDYGDEGRFLLSVTPQH